MIFSHLIISVQTYFLIKDVFNGWPHEALSSTYLPLFIFFYDIISRWKMFTRWYYSISDATSVNLTNSI